MKLRAALLALVIAVAGCKSGSSSTTEARKPDATLEPAAYVALGLPKIETTWSPADFDTAAPVIEKLGAQRPTVLPRWSSSRSTPVFQRMTDRTSFDSLTDDTLPLAIRMAAASGGVPAAARILRVYLQALAAGQDVEKETFGLLLLCLHASAVQWTLLDEYIPTLDTSDSGYMDRIKGLDKVKAGTAQQISGALATLDEPHQKANLTWFAGELKADLPKLFTRISTGEQHEMHQRLAHTKITQNEGPYATALGELMVAIDAAIAK